MTEPAEKFIRFKRNRFSARFPTDRLYTRSHFWVREIETGLWRAGLTGFATRMLGEIVEYDFEVEPGEKVALAQTVGWIEGFKAVSDLYCVGIGEFAGGNPPPRDDWSVVSRDPYEAGWLYAFRGTPDPDAVDINGYVDHLNLTVDKMLEKPGMSGEVGL